tara:strand:- start:157 stop:528 length:372 start_codon:yes stop_codon:yes gene_type:complete
VLLKYLKFCGNYPPKGWKDILLALKEPFMKATYSPTLLSPLVWLPPEMLERVYLYCTQGRLSIQEMRRLYAAGVLLGIEGMADRQIVHHAVVEGMQLLLEQSEKCATEEQSIDRKAGESKNRE